MPAQCSFFNELGVLPARKLLRTRRPTRAALVLTIFGLDMLTSLKYLIEPGILPIQLAEC